ncbi:MAG: disulfide bond formation protein B [Acidimicrobiales bacterium]
MAYETATLFFALLAGALGLLLVGLGALAIFDRDDRTGIRASVRSVALEAAAAIAVACTAGSLYLSEVAGFLPCRLCWVQRAFMYPAAALLVLALVTKQRVLATIAAVLAVLGLPVALFHRYEQAAGEVGGVCDPTNPCSGRWINHFGFVTIPTMAAVGFLAILVFVVMDRRDDEKRSVS